LFYVIKKNGVVKQTNLSRRCFSPSLRKNKQLFKTTRKVQILIKKSRVGCLFFVGFFSKDDLMQIDTTPARNMKRGEYKRRISLVNSAQLDRH
jgi:hypothetical protein